MDERHDIKQMQRAELSLGFLVLSQFANNVLRFILGQVGIEMSQCELKLSKPHSINTALISTRCHVTSYKKNYLNFCRSSHST